MSNGVLHKIKSWVAGDPFEEDVYGMDDEFEYGHSSRQDVEPVSDHNPRKSKQNNLRVLGHPAGGSAPSSQVVVIEPRAFEEALEIVEHLRAKKSIILNLHMLDTSQSQRVVDFLSGATHALDGNQHRIGDGVFIFTPSNVMITSESAAKSMGMAAETYWPTAHR